MILKKTALVAVSFALALLSACGSNASSGTSDETTASIAEITTTKAPETTTAVQTTVQPEAPSKLSEMGDFKIVDVDLKDFAKKAITADMQIALDSGFVDEYPKQMAVIGGYLYVHDYWSPDLYRYSTETFEFIDKKTPPKSAPYEWEKDDPDGDFSRARNHVSFCVSDDVIVAAQHTKVIVYDGEFNVKASYDISPDSKYVRETAGYGTAGIDETHIIYYADGNHIMDLETGEESRINIALDEDYSISVGTIYPPIGGVFFAQSRVLKKDRTYEDEISTIYTKHDYNGKLIDYVYEKNLVENNAIFSVNDGTVYKFPKDDKIIKSVIKKQLRSMKYGNAMGTMNYMLDEIFNDDMLINLRNRTIYSFGDPYVSRNIRNVTASCTDGDKTYVLCSTWDDTEPNILIVI